MKTDLYLTKITIPYYCRVRVYDSLNAASEWSDIHKIRIVVPVHEDSNGNGIPDEDEVSDHVDIDKNDTPDNFQTDIKMVKTEIGGVQIGVKAEGDCTIESLRPNDPAFISCTKNRPAEEFPIGLISYKLFVPKLGDEAMVTVYVSDNGPNLITTP